MAIPPKHVSGIQWGYQDVRELEAVIRQLMTFTSLKDFAYSIHPNVPSKYDPLGMGGKIIATWNDSDHELDQLARS